MDKLDHLLTLYTGRCVEDEAKYFLSLDVTGIEYNEKIKKRMLRYAFKRSRYEQKRYVAKLILAACLIAMSVVFTACMSISEIRDAIWKAVVGWYDDYISVSFEDAPKTTTNNDIVTDENATKAPDMIEQKAYATYLPEGYYAVEELVTSKCLMIDYYDDSDNWKLGLSQTIHKNSNWRVDNKEIDLIKIDLGNCEAILTEYREKENYYTLSWKDEFYVYNLFGYFSSLSEAVQIANGIVLQ